MEDRDAVTTRHVREAVRGDAASVSWIVERFSPLLLAQASQRLRGSLAGLARLHSPEDIVQDVWTRTLPRLGGLEPRGGRITPVVVRFLATTLLNRLNSLMQVHLRVGGQPRTEVLGEVAEAGLSAEATQAVSQAVRREQGDAVRAAIEELEDSDREIVVMRGIEQNPVADIALVLGEKPNTISVKYRRALERLRQRLPGSIFDELSDGE